MNIYISIALALIYTSQSFQLLNHNPTNDFETRTMEWYSIKVPVDWVKVTGSDLRRVERSFPRETDIGTQYWRDFMYMPQTKHNVNEGVAFTIQVYEITDNILDRYLNSFESNGYEFKEVAFTDLYGYYRTHTSTDKYFDYELERNVDVVFHKASWYLKGSKYFFYFELQATNNDELLNSFLNTAEYMVSTLKERG